MDTNADDDMPSQFDDRVLLRLHEHFQGGKRGCACRGALEDAGHVARRVLLAEGLRDLLDCLLPSGSCLRQDAHCACTPTQS